MLSADIEELYSLIEEAENCIKEAEYVKNEGFYLPSINELRYSLRHLIQYIKDNRSDDLVECKAHIKRSMYDALEVRIIILMERTRRFRRLYYFVFIPKVITNWLDIVNELEDTKSLLSLDDGAKSRADKLKNAIQRLEQISKTLENAKPELNKILFINIFKLLAGFITFLASLAVLYNFAF